MFYLAFIRRMLIKFVYFIIKEVEVLQFITLAIVAFFYLIRFLFIVLFNKNIVINLCTKDLNLLFTLLHAINLAQLSANRFECR